MRILVLATLLLDMAGTVQEPTPRRLASTAIPIGKELATVSGAREMRDGRLLLSDAKRAAVLLVDPRSGATTQLGSAGGDSTQYAQPGGMYAGLADTTLLLDRGQARFLVISPSGAILTSRSIRRRGFSSSSDDDIDHQRIDARGLAYFTEPRRSGQSAPGMVIADSSQLLRFDAGRQHADTVALLQRRLLLVTQASERVTTSQTIIGSPEDDWGVAPNGRIAVVRAAPYRVEWHSPDGHVMRGNVIPVKPLPFSAAEKAFISSAGTVQATSGGAAGGVSVSTANQGTRFSSFKAPFESGAVIVSPQGQVWIARNLPAGVTATVYDVFDDRGGRIDRVELAAGARVIGFGKNSIYAVERDARGIVSLKKYRLS